MIYAAIYFFIGLLALLGISAEKLLREKKSEWNKMSDIVRHAKMTAFQIFLDRFVVPAIVVVLIVFAWPLAAIFAVKFFRDKKRQFWTSI